MISPELLELLVCPEDRTPLALADANLVARLNRALGEGRLKNRAGQVLETPLDGGLVRADGQVLYPIIDRIPVLLVDEGILLDRNSDG
jgi:uncharacterized protein YbaR (Trm112 family)